MSAATRPVVLDGFLIWDPNRARNTRIFGSPFTWSAYKPNAGPSDDRILVGPQQITVDVPVAFDPRGPLVANLEERKRKLQAEFAACVTEINRQISELTAIECSEAS